MLIHDRPKPVFIQSCKYYKYIFFDIKELILNKYDVLKTNLMDFKPGESIRIFIKQFYIHRLFFK